MSEAFAIKNRETAGLEEEVYVFNLTGTTNLI